MSYQPPARWRIHVQVQVMIITFRITGRVKFMIPRTVRALQTLALSGGCALLVRTLRAHMLRQDKKFKIKSIMNHKTFKLDIIGSCISYMMIGMFLRCLKCFVRYVCTCWAKAHSYISYCRKEACSLNGGPCGRCGG